MEAGSRSLNIIIKADRPVPGKNFRDDLRNLRRCVCFVYRTRQGDTLRTPFGTAFLVVVIEQAAGAPLPIWYAVTASHVVSPVDMRGESHDLYLRWPHRAGEADQFEPIDPDKWQRHPDADLAITRVRRSDLVASNQRPRAYWPIFSTQLAGADHLLRPEVGEGDTVFMVGLFSASGFAAATAHLPFRKRCAHAA